MLNLFHVFIIAFMFIFYFIYRHDGKEKTNREKIIKKYNSVNKGVSNSTTQLNLIKRNELKKMLDSDFTKADRQFLLNRFENKCYKCGNANNLEIDHHVPLTLGYPLKENKNYNAVVLCKNCNRKKSDLLPQEFYTQNELKILEDDYRIVSHLNVDTTRINRINKILISEKVKLLNNAIEKKKPISFEYIEMGNYNVFHEKHTVKVKPLEAYENMEFGIKKNKKFYVLKAKELNTDKVKEYNLSYILDLKIG